MKLLDSLLDAIVRLNGDALVMHVGEKPYVVTTSEAKNEFRGPIAWGQVELSSRVLTPEAVGGMLGQILPLDQRGALDEFGATEFEVTAATNPDERFTIVAARGGDDIWLEVRRLAKQFVPAMAAAAVAPPAAAAVGHAAPAAEAAGVEAPVAVAAVAYAEPVAVNAAEAEVARHGVVHSVDEAPATAAVHAHAPVVVTREAAAGEAPSEVALPEPIAAERATSRAEAEAIPQPVVSEASTDVRLDVDAPAIHAVDRPVAAVDEQAALAVDDVAVLGDAVGEDADAIEEGPAVEEIEEIAQSDVHADVVVTGAGGELELIEEEAPEIPGPPALALPTAEEIPEEAIEMEEPAPQSFDLPVEVEQQISAAAHEWGEDVMTEGELGELLRASAAAVITGETTTHAVDVDAAVAPTAENRDAAGETTAPLAAEMSLANQEALQAARDAYMAAEQALPVSQNLHEPAMSEPVNMSSDQTAAPTDAPVPVAAGQPDEETVSAAPQPEDDESQPARPVAVVVPLTRQTRGDAVAETRTVSTTLHRLLRLGAARGASAIHLASQSVPMVRVDGEFNVLDGEPVTTSASIERILAELAPKNRDAAAQAAEWLMDVPEMGRVRCVSFRDHRGPGLVIRIVPPRAISADQLGLSGEVQALGAEADGLVIVTGGRASGRSTLLASFVDLINRTRSDHIITTEPQIHFVHENRRSLVSQREVRGDADAVATAVRAAIREEPDVLVIEDVRTPELVSLALESAESGRLVFCSMTAPSTVSAIERMIELFPAERREKIQASLAGTLRGVVSQVLLRKLRGGRVAAREVLLNTPAVANLILEGKTFQLPAALDSGRRYGMQPFAESLAALVREGVVHPSHAHRRAPNREQLLAILRRDGVDTSVAERLA